MQACNELMPEYKGRVAGIILCCFSLGSLLFNTIITYLCNPDSETPVNIGGNTFYEGDIAGNFPYMLRTISVIFAIMGTIGIVLCFRKNDKVPPVTEQRLISKEASGKHNAPSILTYLTEPLFVSCYI